MDGDHGTLARIAGSFFEEPLKSFVVDLVYHLFFYQYVTDGVDIWEVRRGSCMGMMHSSNLADLVFHGLVEWGLCFDSLHWPRLPARSGLKRSTKMPLHLMLQELEEEFASAPL